MRINIVEPVFVEFMPDTLDEGFLYISMSYGTAIHKCCCGCGNKVVTPFSPTDWKLFYDGDSISLSPSIGNWNFKCQSHYWIKKNKIDWTGKWSKNQIDDGRKFDKLKKSQYFQDKTDNKKEIILTSSSQFSVFNKFKKFFSQFR